MDWLRKVQKGDRYMPSAQMHNATVDVVRAFKASQVRQGAGIATQQHVGTVLVINNSGSTVPQFGVLGVSGVAYALSAKYAAMAEPLPLVGVTPSAATPNWVVVQEPIAAGGIGRAVIFGATVARLLVTTTSDPTLRFADAGATTEGLVPAASGQAEIIAQEPGLGTVNAVVRIGNTVSTGAGVMHLGVVVAPSSNGATTSSYTVDIYGTTTASLSSSPTATAQTAVQVPASNAYYRGEVVGVSYVDGAWRIAKFLTLPIAYTVAAQQVGLRIAPGAFTTAPTRFIADLANCLSYFNGGSQTATAWATFSYQGYAGLGRISTSLAIPVRIQSGWELAVPTGFFTTNYQDAARAIVAGNPSLASSLDYTVGVSSGPSGDASVYPRWTGTFTPGGSIRYLSDGGTGPLVVLDSLALEISTIAFMSGSLATSIWGDLGLPTLADGGIDDGNNVLLAANRVRMTPNETLTGGGANALDPTADVYRRVLAGDSSPLGLYDRAPTAGTIYTEVTVS